MKILKNKLGLGLIAVFTLVLAGCNLIPAKDANKTTGDNQSESMMAEPLSEDTDLNTVETELNDTQLNDFNSELNGLDQEINNL